LSGCLIYHYMNGWLQYATPLLWEACGAGAAERCIGEPLLWGWLQADWELGCVAVIAGENCQHSLVWTATCLISMHMLIARGLAACCNLSVVRCALQNCGWVVHLATLSFAFRCCCFHVGWPDGFDVYTRFIDAVLWEAVASCTSHDEVQAMTDPPYWVQQCLWSSSLPPSS
jgi:hypothetical protein